MREKKRLVVLTSAYLCLTFSYVPVSFAKPPGTTPFGFWKATAGFIFQTIGAYGQALTSWSTTANTASASSDGALGSLGGIAVDSTNNFIFASSHFRIVKHNATTGAFIGAIGYSNASTGTCPAGGYASGWCTGGTFQNGTGNGGYQGTGGIAFDAANDLLYVVDGSNHRIVKITASTGAFIGAIGKTTSTIGACPASGAVPGWCAGGTFGTGTGDGMFANPRDIALNAAGDSLYITDLGNNRVVKVVASTGAFVGAIGKTTATTGTCPASGSATGWCTGGTFASGALDGQFTLSNSGGIGYDSTNDKIIIGDRYRVVRHTASSGAFAGAIGNLTATSGTCPASGRATTWCTGGTFLNFQSDGGFVYVNGVGVDTAGNLLYFTDSSNHRISKHTLSTGAPLGGIGKSTFTSGTCPASGVATGWCTMGYFATGPLSGMFANPVGFALDIAHNVFFIADQGNNRIQKITLSTGAAGGYVGLGLLHTPAWASNQTIVSTNNEEGFTGIVGTAVDATNNILYVSDTGRRVIKLNAATGAVIGAIGSSISSTGTCPSSGVAPGWCTGGAFSNASTDGAFNGGGAIAVDVTNSFIFVLDSSDNRIMKINATTGAFVGSIGRTQGITTGTCPINSVASAWCTGGSFWAGTIDKSYSSPRGLAVDPVANVMYVADTGNHRIVKVTLSTGAFVGAIGNTSATIGTCPASGAATGWCTGGTFASGTGNGMFFNPYAVAVNNSTDTLYVADSTNGRISKFTASTGAYIGSIGNTTATSGTCPATGAAPGWCTGGTFGIGTGNGMFSNPRGLTIDTAADALYVAEYGNNRVTKIVASTGAHVGSIGRISSTTGTCPVTGPARKWCTGGIFSNVTTDGGFSSPLLLAIDPGDNYLYITDWNSSHLQRTSK